MSAFERFSLLFPVWVLLCVGVTLIEPGVFTWFSGLLIQLGLAGIMLSMGLTLLPLDFERVFKFPLPVLLGILLQYTIMPFLGYAIGSLLGLEPGIKAGLVLVASCPGGTASNVVAFLARANVALSVTMTAFSTLLSALATPTAVELLLSGSEIDVSFFALFQSTVLVVVLPVLLGVFLNRTFGRTQFVHRIKPALPAVAVILICLIVASIIGKDRALLLESGPIILLATVLLHLGGFVLGYLISRIVLRLQPDVEGMSRTISIEVGMQNSGLGVVLARNHFSMAVVALPPAVSSVVHSLIGSALSVLWRRYWPDPGSNKADAGS
ncbi:MAG: bile acid:sodium symporter family protein [Leptospiraceae bacterium]|nr:bile acid:sodium symporter family protein [Leptospiraceae bacterium]